jgi:nicotinamide-nucleotide amidase
VSLVVELISTGDELLTGQLVDTNSTWLMDRLWDLGLMVRRKTLVGDDRDDLTAIIREACGRADAVVMSGGLGPTEDDLTAEVVAAVVGVPLEIHAATLASIEARFAALGRPMTPNNVRQARVPRGAEVHPSRFGLAPAFSVTVGRATLTCLPGVPSEFKGLCQEAVLPRLASRLGPAPAARLLKLLGVGESFADQAMRPVMDDPANRDVRFGYRAHFPEVHLKWMVPGVGAEARAAAIETQVRAIFGDAVWGAGKEELAALVVARLTARGEKVALAESCTGGLVAEQLTAVPGASAVLDLGVVAYANEVKAGLLEVPRELLQAHGAVSEPVARALAEGARRLGAATWGLGITGIAGPTGGTPEKPVGTVHLALAGPDGTEAVRRHYRWDRARVRQAAAWDALNLLRRALLDQDELDRLRSASGLAVDGEGRFLHRGEPITHARTLEALWRSLSRTPAGRWQVRIGRETAFVEVDESPWAVRGLRSDGPTPTALTLLLAGGAEVPLDPAALWIGPDGVLRSRLPDGAPVRFTRAGQVALGSLLEADPDHPGGYLLVLGGVRHPIRVAGAAPGGS